MPNAITLAQQFVPLLDETYQLASLTADLDGNADLVRQGANANELIIPMLSMQGLGDYSRNDKGILLAEFLDCEMILISVMMNLYFHRRPTQMRAAQPRTRYEHCILQMNLSGITIHTYAISFVVQENILKILSTKKQENRI